MHYAIIETCGIGAGLRRNTVRTADTFADAVKLAHEMYKIIDFEVDAMNPRCADFFTASCQVMSIEPVGFKLNAA